MVWNKRKFEPSSYPVNAEINGRPDWRLPSGPPGSDLVAMQSHLLDRLRPSFAICNVIHGAQVMLSEEPVRQPSARRSTTGSGRSGWTVIPRLRASIVVPPHSAELAVEEIEHLAPDHTLRSGSATGDDRVAARTAAELADL